MSLNKLPANQSTEIYTDLKGLQNLKLSAKKDASKALPEVARQFEAVMISMMLKSLRKTGLEDPYFSSQAMDSYRDMYDQQLSMELSKGQGIGVAAALLQQMKGYQNQGTTQETISENNSVADAARDSQLKMPVRRQFPDYSVAEQLAPPVNNDQQNQSVVIQEPESGTEFTSPEQFVTRFWPLAEKTAQKMGINAEVILSQAALETGWGKHIISNDQRSSFNLFNIKADKNWPGKRMAKVSIEYLGGKGLQARPVQQQSDFRAYESFEQSFNDYADFIRNSPRYQKILQNINKSEQTLHNEKYISELHQAGYATDPAYANKVMSVLNSDVIQNQLIERMKLASK